MINLCTGDLYQSLLPHLYIMVLHTKFKCYYKLHVSENFVSLKYKFFLDSGGLSTFELLRTSNIMLVVLANINNIHNLSFLFPLLISYSHMHTH